ncbi:OmpA family protein [Aquipuribacter sp. SD81]|uniref:OmpA family protein n=1 Tax=Aquipuribacter sp. SD81 TaxID=3127703 RepID=UPI003019C018
MTPRWPVRFHEPRARSPWPAVATGVLSLAVLVPVQVALVDRALDPGAAGGGTAVAAPPPTPAVPTGPTQGPGETSAGASDGPARPGPSDAPGETSRSSEEEAVPEASAAAAQTVVVSFDTGAVTVPEADLDRLDDLVSDAGPSSRFVVTGFAEPSGDAVLEDQLSLGRAEAVVEVLLAEGVDAQRVRTVAAGAADPAPPGTPPRRVSVELVP